MNTSKFLQSITVAVSSALILSACSDSVQSTAGEDFNSGSGNNGGSTTFNETALLSNLTNNVITPAYLNFETLANQLHLAVEQYCSVETAFNNGSATAAERDNELAAAQQSWQSSMEQWQKIEVMQLGPLIENQSLLRNQIYSWPVTSTCAVDQDVVYFNQGDINGEPYNIANRVATRRGLDALEYLLFNENLEHSCSSTTAPDGWDNLTSAERRQQRCAFATEVASDIGQSSQILLNAWDGNNGYAASLLNAANEPGSDFANAHEAVNRISDAMFYIDSVTKDGKLGVPLGLFENDCQQSLCPQDLESQYAYQSLDHIRNNLISLKSLFTGEVNNSEDTTGFDDFLIEEGASMTANNMRTAIDAAIADVEAYQQNLSLTLQNNDAQVRETHRKVKAITDQLKTDFINQLALELPATSAGDND